MNCFTSNLLVQQPPGHHTLLATFWPLEILFPTLSVFGIFFSSFRPLMFMSFEFSQIPRLSLLSHLRSQVRQEQASDLCLISHVRRQVRQEQASDLYLPVSVFLIHKEDWIKLLWMDVRQRWCCRIKYKDIYFHCLLVTSTVPCFVYSAGKVSSEEEP